MAKFQMSQNSEVACCEPLLHGRRMYGLIITSIEGRIPYLATGTLEVSADKE